jgi:hypothetical protein
MANAFILFSLLIPSNAYFFIRSRRKARESPDPTEAEIAVMKPHCSLALLFLFMLVLPVQAKDVANTSSSESNDSPLVSDLSVEQFSEVVKAIVRQTLEECAVEGDMKGKAKLNLDVTGDVTAKIVCETDNDTEKK